MSNFRVRVSGILLENDEVLILEQSNSGRRYSIPGGGVEFEETIEQAIIREFKEETGLSVLPDRILYVSEYFKDEATHVVEIAILVHRTDSLEKIIVGEEPDSVDHEIKNCIMVNLDELKEAGMEKLASKLRNELKYGEYTGLRSK